MTKSFILTAEQLGAVAADAFVRGFAVATDRRVGPTLPRAAHDAWLDRRDGGRVFDEYNHPLCCPYNWCGDGTIGCRRVECIAHAALGDR